MARPDTFSLSSDSHDRASSSGTADIQTITPPAGASGFLIAVETTNARVTFDGSTPASTNGLVYPKDVAPVEHHFLPEEINWTSTAAAASIVDVCWLF